MMIRTMAYFWRAWPPFVLLGAVLWYLCMFQPNISTRSELIVSGDRFVFNNYSYKTALSNTLCDKPSLAIIVFEDSARNVRNVVDNAPGYGSGDASVRQWQSTGRIPGDLVDGIVRVKKKVIYPCLFGTVREIFTEEHIFLKSTGTGD